MSDASELIAQQMQQAGVTPGELTPVGGVTKTYVDEQDAMLQGNINGVAALAGASNQTANQANLTAGQALGAANAAQTRSDQAFTEAHSAFGISEQALAQAQKNAAPSFNRVNDIEALDVKTQLNIAQGTGITVTTDPSTKTLTITATGQSTPGPHAESHLTGGSDPIPVATITADGLAPKTLVKEVADARVATAFNKTYSNLEERLNNTDALEIKKGVDANNYRPGRTDRQAIEAALTVSNVVYISGDYTIDDTIIFATGGKRIIGINGARIIMSVAAGTKGTFAASSKEDIYFEDVAFVGNGVTPAVPGTAASAAFFLECRNVVFENCKFTNYLGIGLGFQGGKNCSALNCEFSNHGQNLSAFAGQSPKAVPAIWSAYENEGLIVRDCKFEDCRFSAVFLLGKNGLVENCKISNIGESGIFCEWSSVSPAYFNRILNNEISSCYKVDITACGVECAAPYTVIEGNRISNCDADGISAATGAGIEICNNTSYNNNAKNTFGASGIGISHKPGIGIPATDALKFLKIESNTCFDTRATPYQEYGINITADNGSAEFEYGSLVDNQTYRNKTSDLRIAAGMFESDKNTIRGNSAWKEYIKNLGSVSTSSTSGQAQLKFSFVPAGSMGKRGGIRIKAWGRVTGTAGQKGVYLKHDTSQVEFASLIFPANSNGAWEINAVINNADSVSNQLRSATTFLSSAYYKSYASSGSVDTSLQKAISVLGQVDNAADSVICDGLILERM